MADYDPNLTIEGSGPPLVLVPGMDGTGQLFYRQVPLLAKRFRVATYALRNSARKMDVLVDDLAAVLDRVSPQDGRAIVVGESFGGALAMSLAVAKPEQVAALVVLNSFAYFAPQLRLHLAIAALSTVPWHVMDIVRQLTAFRLHSRHTHRDDLRRFMELTRAASREGYLNRLHVLTQFDVREQLHGLQLPTLFLAADCDHLVPAVSQARDMTARVANAEMRVLEGHGHICLIAPDLSLADILEEWGGWRRPALTENRQL